MYVGTYVWARVDDGQLILASLFRARTRARDARSSRSFRLFLTQVYKYTPLLTLLHWISLARILRNAVGREPELRKRRTPLTSFGGELTLQFSFLNRASPPFARDRPEVECRVRDRRERSRRFSEGISRNFTRSRACDRPRFTNRWRWNDRNSQGCGV